MFTWRRVGLTGSGSPLPPGLHRFTVSVGDLFYGEVNDYVDEQNPHQATWQGLFQVIHVETPDSCWKANWTRDEAMDWVEGKIQQRIREMDDARSHPIRRIVEESVQEITNVRVDADATEYSRRGT